MIEIKPTSELKADELIKQAQFVQDNWGLVLPEFEEKVKSDFAWKIPKVLPHVLNVFMSGEQQGWFEFGKMDGQIIVRIYLQPTTDIDIVLRKVFTFLQNEFKDNTEPLIIFYLRDSVDGRFSDKLLELLNRPSHEGTKYYEHFPTSESVEKLERDIEKKMIEKKMTEKFTIQSYECKECPENIIERIVPIYSLFDVPQMNGKKILVANCSVYAQANANLEYYTLGKDDQIYSFAELRTSKTQNQSAHIAAIGTYKNCEGKCFAKNIIANIFSNLVSSGVNSVYIEILDHKAESIPLALSVGFQLIEEVKKCRLTLRDFHKVKV